MTATSYPVTPGYAIAHVLRNSRDGVTITQLITIPMMMMIVMIIIRQPQDYLRRLSIENVGSMKLIIILINILVQQLR